MLRRLFIFVFFMSFSVVFSQQQKEKDSINKLEEVVITATKTHRQLSSLSVPVTLISKKDISKTGTTKLQDILQEHTGISIVYDHGAGIQVQGLESDYVLILIDGEPLVGRIAGTLDLNRLNVNEIEQIEVVKGPSSSLYGSEALAGVVNIITKKAKRTGASIRAKYESNNTIDLSATANLVGEKGRAQVYVSHFQTDGYDLTPKTFNKTVAPYNAQTYGLKLGTKLKNTKLMLQSRWYQEKENYDYKSEGDMFKSIGKETDFSVTPKVVYSNEKLSAQLKGSFTKYGTSGDIKSGDKVLESSYFKELRAVLEAQVTYDIHKKHSLLFGLGMVKEGVNASRLSDNLQHNAFNHYLFTNYEWHISSKANVVAGLRIDKHDHYKTQFNPKFSAYYKVLPQLRLLASIGAGFKKPTFQQIYLNFTNYRVGYSVFGVSYVKEGVEKLIDTHQIKINPSNNQPILFDHYRTIIDNDSKILPETSVGINFGFKYNPVSTFFINGSFFRNDLSNLIEAVPVALKTNNMNVFSYINISKIFSQGFTFDIKYYLNENIKISAGYQYLDVRDKKMVELLKEGKVFAKNKDGISYRIKSSDYGGLMNRSKHSANFKMSVREIFYGIGNYTRLIYKGKYGYRDKNGNGILDQANEYVDGYFLLNTNFTKSFGTKWQISAGVYNILDTKIIKDDYIASGLSGRIFNISINYKF